MLQTIDLIIRMPLKEFLLIWKPPKEIGIEVPGIGLGLLLKRGRGPDPHQLLGDILAREADQGLEA